MLSRKSSKEPLDTRDLPLLKPIMGAAAAGRSVRYDDYAQIGEARRAENAALPQGVWVRDVKRADWETVERLCVETLTARSKDLWVACWLTEAWTQRHGFPGLGRGLALLAQLCEGFWPDLYPALDAGDVGARVAPFEWLNQHIPVLLNLLPLVVDTASDRQFNWSNLREAQRLEHVRLRDAAAAQRAEAKGAITLQDFTACERQTDPARFAGVSAAIGVARRRLDGLDAILTVACGRDAPGFGRIRDVLGEIEGYAGSVLRARAAGAAPPTALEPLAATDLTSSTTLPPAVRPGARSRRSAFRDLAEIAEFFEANEPHSPVPLVLRELVAWETMSLPELQARLHLAGSDVAVLLQVLGVMDDISPKAMGEADSTPDTF